LTILVLRSGHNGDDLLDDLFEDLDDGCNDCKGAHLVVSLTLLPVVVVVVAAATEEGAESTEGSTFSSLTVVVTVVVIIVVVIVVAVIVVVISTHAEEGAKAAEGALQPLSLSRGDLPGVDFVEDLEELGYLFNGAGLLSFFDRARGDMVDSDGEDSDNQEGPHDDDVH